MHCWEMCKMVMESFEIWGPICLVRDVCPPGCQLACNFMEDEKNDSDSPPSILLVRNVYEPNTDRVSVEWVPDRDQESESAVLYSVFLKDENQPWNQIAQTTSHVVHIKRGLLGRNSEIRVIAANATKQVSDSQILHLGSHVAETSFEHMMKHSKNSWKPYLKTLEESEKGMHASIIWPAKEDENEPMLYEVSWSVTAGTIEITGHLQTNNNTANLTLWPNSEYSVMISCLGANKTLLYKSEALLINTKSSNISKEDQKISPSPCAKENSTAVIVLSVTSAFLLVSLIITIIWDVKTKTLVRTNACKVKTVIGNAKQFQVKIPEILHKKEQNKTALEDKLARVSLI